MSHAAIVRFEEPAALARAAAQRWEAAAERAVAARGRFDVVLSGGSTPRALYRLLASDPYRERLPWARTVVLFGDERSVPPDHEESNYRMARESLLDHVPVPGEQVHRMEGERSDPDEAAARYERVLRRLYPEKESPRPRTDLVLLGMGQDGHTASLFPGTPALEETRRWVVTTVVPGLDATRLTLTFPALNAARHVLFLVVGKQKARVLEEAFGGAPHSTPYPCERVRPTDGLIEVLAAV